MNQIAGEDYEDWLAAQHTETFAEQCLSVVLKEPRRQAIMVPKVPNQRKIHDIASFNENWCGKNF